MWVVAQRVDDCTRNEWQVVQAETFCCAELVTMSTTNTFDVFVVDFDNRVGVRRNLLRHHHVFASTAADVVQRLDGVAGT